MTSPIPLQRLSALAFAALVVTFGRPAKADDAWTLAKNADGIQVYVHDVPGSALREFRGEVTLTVSTARIVKVLRDPSAFRKWMPDVVTSELLKATDRDQYHYLENYAPWPVSHRDGVYHFTFSTQGEGSAAEALVRVEAVPDYLPAREGKVRIPMAEGSWRIVPSGSGVRVTYQMHADPGGALPSWLANSAVIDTPFRTLEGLKTYLSSPAS